MHNLCRLADSGTVREFLANAAAAPEPFFLYYAASHVHVPQNHDPRWDSLIPDTPFAQREGGGREFAVRSPLALCSLRSALCSLPLQS
jgi:hypothetical protein